MPFFKSTYNILSKPWEDEVFNPNWMDSDKLILPPKKDWDYSRPLQIEDVNIWEVIFERSNGIGLYASWDPYAEFYLFTSGFTKYSTTENPDKYIETFYGPGVQKNIKEKLISLGIPIPNNEVWVEPEQMWLYS